MPDYFATQEASISCGDMLFYQLQITNLAQNMLCTCQTAPRLVSSAFSSRDLSTSVSFLLSASL